MQNPVISETYPRINAPARIGAGILRFRFSLRINAPAITHKRSRYIPICTCILKSCSWRPPSVDSPSNFNAGCKDGSLVLLPIPAPDDEPDAPPSGGAESAAAPKSENTQREDADLADNPEYQRRLAALQAEMRNGKAETSSPSPEKTMRPPERPVESSDRAKPPPMPPSFDE